MASNPVVWAATEATSNDRRPVEKSMFGAEVGISLVRERGKLQ